MCYWRNLYKMGNNKKVFLEREEIVRILKLINCSNETVSILPLTIIHI